MYMLDDAPHGYLLNEVDGIELWSRTLTKTELYGSLLSSKIIKDPEKFNCAYECKSPKYIG